MSREARDQAILDAVGGRRANGKGHIRANCPWCITMLGKEDRKQCLTFNSVTGWWKCYRCEQFGKLDELPFDLATAAKPKTAEEQEPPVNLPEGYVPLWMPEGQAISLRPAQKYLASRNVTMEQIERHRIGACVKGRFAERIVVPIYRAGKLAGYVGRTWYKNHARKYLYNEGFNRAITLYNEEAVYKTTEEPLLVVEGTFDTFPFEGDGVALLGKASPAQMDMLHNARRPVAVVLDGDAWREAAAMAMNLRLGGKRACDLRLPPGVDPDECVAEVRARARAAFADGGDGS